MDHQAHQGPHFAFLQIGSGIHTRACQEEAEAVYVLTLGSNFKVIQPTIKYFKDFLDALAYLHITLVVDL